MSSMFDPSATRRAFVAAAAASVLPAVGHSAPARVVTLFGDSLTAGYGLPSASALPTQLQAEIKRLGVPAVIRGAGVSGDTTATGLARVDRSVRGDTDLCVVALGGNDLLLFNDPARTRANLDRIIRRLKARKIGVVLVGVGAPPELGAYATAFNGVYASLAREHGVPLYADILSGVARDPALNQGDGIHPNARGVAVIARRLAPVIGAALKRA